MLRIPLDTLLLQMKAMTLPSRLLSLYAGNSTVSEAISFGGYTDSSDICHQLLALCLDVPTMTNINKGVHNLMQLQALEKTGREGNFRLTALGRFLSWLPCSPRVGRLILYGLLLRCVYPAVLLGAIINNSKGNPCMSSAGNGGNDLLSVLTLCISFHELG